jgi:hypothetical protein
MSPTGEPWRLIGASCFAPSSTGPMRVGRHDLDGLHAVAGPAVPSGEIPEPAAQRKPGDPRGGDEAEWGGEPMQLGLPVHIAEQAAGLRPRAARHRVDPHTAHRRHVEQEPAVAHGEPGNVVPAALYRQREVACPCELDAGDDVRRPETADHERRPAIDHAVPDGACLVVPWIAGPHERAPQAGCQRGNLAAAWSRGRARNGGCHRDPLLSIAKSLAEHALWPGSPTC